ncbi:SDR family oxidoreductase [Mesorhizobium sp. ES1-6]|uniref:SDR family oxidoreductase n=1 Tax=Mesorhizobium sp. ES1-6 TaxID=2876626 RepID=UPI001CCF19B7|nr:SDR family oxidoreductase [Mesorhizobium sp. ES1-6]MBZ9801141.1 SDR family oxidoreductase [Mesorhizobium sp. ES1-6]
MSVDTGNAAGQTGNSFSRFDGKVAIVTGSTQGLGEAICELMVARGLSGLVITGRNRERGEAVAGRLRAAGCRTVFVPADLSRHGEVLGIVEACDREFGRVDILVNAAGNTDRGTILDTEEALYDQIFATNVKAPFYLMQKALGIMVRENIRGSVVNIISMSAHGGQSFLSAYCAAKGALVTLTRNTGFSMMRHGCRVNGLCIGWMYTPGEEQTMRRWHNAQDGWREEAEAKLPIGRMLETGEVARAVAFLCAAESGMMTGSVVDYDQSIPGCFDAVPQPPDIPLGIQAKPPVG